jgi:hypothetical protein
MAPVARAQNDGQQAGVPSASGSDSATLALPGAVESGQLAPLAPVESGQLPPPAGTDGVPASGFTNGFWQGGNEADALGLIAKMELPLRSPAMAGLWRRAMLTDEEPGGAGSAPGQFLAARLDGLYRAGQLKDAAALIAKSPKATDAQQLAAGARVLLGLGDDAKACAAVKTIPLSGGPLKGRVRNDALLMVAFCAARDKQPNHASLAAEVLRDQNFAEPLALAVLDSIAESKTPKLPRTDNLTLIDYKFLTLLGNVPAERFLPRAAPDLIVGIANDPSAEPASRLAAAEAAIRLNAYEDTDLAGLYNAAPFTPEQIADPGAAVASLAPQLQRALLFQAAEHDASPDRKFEALRQLLSIARRDSVLVPVARLVAPLIDAVRPRPDLAGFAETAIEALLAAGHFDHAVGWTLLGGTTAGPGGNALLHWLSLVDVGDPEGHVPHGSSMKYAEDLAAGGAFSPVMLQRLATVLDALRYDVPIPIWQGAQNAAGSISKADQGHLPDTGLLPKLQAAAKAKSTGMTVLLALATVGPGAATSAHPIALGETIKALEDCGLDADARRLAFEALFDAWPRRPGG